MILGYFLMPTLRRLVYCGAWCISRIGVQISCQRKYAFFGRDDAKRISHCEMEYSTYTKGWIQMQRSFMEGPQLVLRSASRGEENFLLAWKSWPPIITADAQSCHGLLIFSPRAGPYFIFIADLKFLRPKRASHWLEPDFHADSCPGRRAKRFKTFHTDIFPFSEEMFDLIRFTSEGGAQYTRL